MLDITPQLSALKVCTKCGESFSATAEYFHRDKHRNDGLYPICKECVRAYGVAHKEEIAERRRAYYVAHKEEVNEQSRAWRATHKEEIDEYNRAYRAANKEEGNERSRAYYAAHKEEISARVCAYNQAHKEKMSKRARAWQKANPLKVRATHQRRRARKRNAVGSYTAADIEAQYKRQKGRCYWCDVKVGETYHMDHVVPLSRGGSDLPENLVVACPTCNCSKHDKLPHEWPQGGRLL